MGLLLIVTAPAARAQRVSFNSPKAYPVGSAYSAFAAVADFNADGRLDLAASNADTNSVSILLGTGKGGFGPPVSYAAGAQPEFIVVADFNRDGKPDLAVGLSLSTTVAILMGNGDGTFQPPLIYQAGTSPTRWP